MAAHKASPLQLSSELEREPNQLVRAHSTPRRLAARARIIMVASAGPGDRRDSSATGGLAEDGRLLAAPTAERGGIRRGGGAPE